MRAIFVMSVIKLVLRDRSGFLSFGGVHRSQIRMRFAHCRIDRKTGSLSLAEFSRLMISMVS